MSKLIPTIILMSILFSACHSSVKPESLYGKWKYIKVGKLHANPPDTVNVMTLKIDAPYIQFTTKDSLIIYWGGAVLSHGTFKTEGRNIQFKEILADGKTREFPFYVSNLTDKSITFSTKGSDGSEVTAVKE